MYRILIITFDNYWDLNLYEIFPELNCLIIDPRTPKEFQIKHIILISPQVLHYLCYTLHFYNFVLVTHLGYTLIRQ